MQVQRFGDPFSFQIHPFLDLFRKIEELEIAVHEFSIKAVKDHLLSFLTNPQMDALHLQEVSLETLYPIIFEPPFRDRVKTVIIERCKASEGDPRLDAMVRFPHLENLVLQEISLKALPEVVFRLPNLKTVSFLDCEFCNCFDLIDLIGRCRNLTFLRVNGYSIRIENAVRKRLNWILDAAILWGPDSAGALHQTLFHFLQLVTEDPVFKEEFCKYFNPETTPDEKKLLLSLLRIGKEYGLRQAKRRGISEFVDYLIHTIRPLELLEEVAMQKARNDAALYPFDPVETYFALLEHLRSAFTWDVGHLPAIPFARNRGLTQEDVAIAKERIQPQLSQEEALCDFLIHREDWREFLRTQFPVEYENHFPRLVQAQNDSDKNQMVEVYFSCLTGLTRRVLSALSSPEDGIWSPGKRTLPDSNEPMAKRRRFTGNWE